jgi:uncharacterized protein (TIRG00374 family)
MKNRGALRTVVSATLRFGIAAAILVYMGMSGAIDWRALAGIVTAWPLMLAALALYAVDLVITSARLSPLMAAHGVRLRIADAVRLMLIGSFFNTCLPGAVGGDAVRLYYATAESPGRRTEVATVMLLDRAVGMFSLLVCPLLLLPFAPELLTGSAALRAVLTASAVVAVAMVAGVLAASSTTIRHSRVVLWLLRVLPLGRHLQRVVDTVHGFRRSPGALLLAVAMSVIAHLMTVGVMLLIVRAIDPSGFSWRMGVLIPLGLVANGLPLTPGGLGVGEAAFTQLFSMAGLRGGAEMMLGWRLLTLIAAVPGFVIYVHGRRQFLEHGSPAVGPVGTGEPAPVAAGDARLAPPPTAGALS